MSMELELEQVPITPHKQDPAWKHCQIFKNLGHRVHIKCMYCDKLFKGGGITRFKEHLAGKKGQGPVCEKVPNDVKGAMRLNLDHVSGKVKKKSRWTTREPLAMTSSQPLEKDSVANHGDAVAPVYQPIEVSNIIEPCTVFVPSGGGEEISNTNSDRRKKRRASGLYANADEVPRSTLALPSERTNGQTQTHMAIGRCMFDVQANLEAVDSVYFQSMIDAIASGGMGVSPPSYRELQGRILKMSVKEVKDDLNACKSVWAKTGCSILVDQWISKKGRTLFSFLVYCPQGTVYLKSVDVSGIIYSVDGLHELLKQVVEEVGVRNVVQVITNGEEQYIFVGKKLMESFPSLYWVPCSVRCIDTMLEDLVKLEWVNATIEQAKSVTKFVYNNSEVLNMMRRFTFGNDILEPGTTSFASNFTTLQRMADFKLNLQSMVTSQDWLDSEHAKKPGGLVMLDIIGNRSFWNSCILINRLTHPLLRALEIVCSKKRPAMGYVYASIYRAKEAMKRELINRNDYATYWRIIDQRWKQQQHLPLHAAGFFLNPRFFYGIQGDLHNDILSAMFDCIERLVPDTKTQDEIVKEINLYKNAVGDLGRNMAVRARDTMLPGESFFI